MDAIGPTFRRSVTRRLAMAVGAVALVLGTPAAALADSTKPAARASDEALRAVVALHVTVPAEARSAATLGRERQGNGVVIDSAGLIVTIGYLILEADSIEVSGAGKTVAARAIGYDNESGLALVRAEQPLGVKPLPLGTAAHVADRAPMIAAAHGSAHGGASDAQPVVVVSRRRFAGYWEYMLDEAIFTAPPIAEFGGAALIDPEGRLVGVGSLLVPDAQREPRFPGNMFVPIDLLKPVMGDLLALGRSANPPRPWLGVITQEVAGSLVVARVAPESPAAKAGLRVGDVIAAIGDTAVASLPELYRAIWSRGAAGVEVPVSVLRHAERQHVVVKSIDRLDFLKSGNTY